MSARFSLVLRAFAALSLALAMPGAASALVIDFSGFAHGEVIGGSGGTTIVTDNFNKAFDLGVVFDTTLRGTADPDLEGPNGMDAVVWSGGNLAVTEILGKVLIIQENNSGCAVVGDICTSPDDEGARPAGDFDITFASPLTAFGFDLIDIEGMMENGSITFVDGGSSFAISFSDFMVGGAFDKGAVFGNNTANRIGLVTPGDVGLTKFDSVTILLAGSGAITNLTDTVLPEPGTALLLVLATALLGRRRA